MRKISLLFFLLFCFSVVKLYAQSCGFEQYFLFVLDVRTSDHEALASGLKMYLVDEAEQPLLAHVAYEETGAWKHRADTLFFWENAQAPLVRGARPLFRRKFFQIGNYYLVAFRLEAEWLKNPTLFPLYRVNIEANPLQGVRQSFSVPLPLHQAVRICNNGITDSFPSAMPVKMLDGNPFEPIVLRLNDQPPRLEVSAWNGGLKYAFRLSYQTIQGKRGEMETYLLNKVRIYSTHTGQLHQELDIPRITPSGSKENPYLVQFLDCYQRGITEALDFSVQTESWRDTAIMGYRQKRNYYVFNPTLQRYELDTLLSNYPDVFEDKTLKVMRRYVFERTKHARITYTYQLADKKWGLVDQSEQRFEPPVSKNKLPIADCLVALSGQSLFLPLKAVVGTNTRVTVSDTIWWYNRCEDTLFIRQIESTTKDFFAITPTILPKQRVPLIFRGILTPNEYDFHIQHFYAGLQFTDGSVRGVTVMVPMVSHQMKAYFRPDSTVNYALGNKPDARFSTAVFTHPNGQLRVKGVVLDRDTSQKLGNWLYFEEGTNRSKQVTYSKLLTLSALDDRSGAAHHQFSVRVRDKGVWKQPAFDRDKQQLHLYLNPSIDSVEAYTDSTRFAIEWSYSESPVYSKQEFYLLKPGERTLKVGYHEMPFQVVENQYSLVFNPFFLRTQKRTLPELMDEVVNRLKKQYPKIALVRMSENQKGFSLVELTISERGEVLQQLVKDSTIALVCQLYTIGRYSRKSYCNNVVYADIDEKEERAFRRKALRLGFSKMELNSGGNRFEFTYPGKLLDESFFEAFHRLTKEKQVRGAFLNSYLEMIEEGR